MTDDWNARVVAARKWVCDHVPLAFLTAPAELFLAGATVLIGLGLVIGDVRPGSVYDQAPHWMARVWAYDLLIGSTLTVVGLLARRPRGLWIGRVLMAYGCAFYGAALLATGHINQVAVAALIFVGMGLTFGWQAFLATAEPYVRFRIAAEAKRALARSLREEKRQ